MQMRLFVFALSLLASAVCAQTYEGSAGGWVLNPAAGQQFMRNYGVIDSSGNYAYAWWSLYNATGVRTTSYLSKPGFRAARLVISGGITYAQNGDGTCYTFVDASGAEVAATCPSGITPPPVPITPPPPPVIQPSPNAKTITLVAVPLRYQSPPSTTQVAIDAYNVSLPKVTQAAIQATFVDISAWWLRETYGERVLHVTVLPDVSLPGNNGCDVGKAVTAARKAALAMGVSTFDIIVGVQPYSCWSWKGVASGNAVTIGGTVTDGKGLYAHEIMHATGLFHNASMFGGVYVEYGSGIDQLGAGSDFVNMRHIASDHKNRWGVLTPSPCVSTTLRDLFVYPDAIQCGAYFLDYPAVTGQVYVHKREFHSGSGGGSDTTDYARLSAGQSYTGGGYTFTHSGSGKVTVK